METRLSMLTRLANQVKFSLPDLTGVKVVVIAFLTVIGGILGARHLGNFDPLELSFYDLMIRLTPAAEPDPNLLIVGVTEQDLRSLKEWPLPGKTMAKLLDRLQSYQPAAIGLDIYRDYPVEPGHKELVKQLQKPNLIAIRNIDTLGGTPAPPEVPPERVGFNDIPADQDSTIRRYLLFAEAEDGVLFSFALQLAILYLGQHNITPQESKINPQYLQLNKAVFVPLAENSGGYHRVDARGYQGLIKYRSAQHLARQISLTQALNGELKSAWIKGKIVLIGSVASSLQDNFLTPYSPMLQKGAKMSGVIIHGQIISQIIDGATGKRSLFQFWSESHEITWIIFWSFIGGLIGWLLRHPLLILVVISGSVTGLFGIVFWLFINSIWVPVAAPMVAFLGTLGLVITCQSYYDYRRQQIVMRLLGQNTSPEIAKALWKGRDNLLKAGKLPGIKLTATILFLDIKGFSTVSEKMTPEELLEWLNEILSDITEEVLSREGIINKFTGDGVLAVFGVPMSRIHKEEVALDAQYAVECALGIRERLRLLYQSWLKRGLPLVQMRIGIFTGPIVVGSLGGKDRLEYGVLGDAVNTAARLEACEKERQVDDCRILIAQETLVHLEDKVAVESWGALALKGKEQMVEVYRVIGLKKTANEEEQRVSFSQ